MPDFFFIGEEELCVAFRLVGVGGKAVANREEAVEAFLEATGRPSGLLRPSAGAAPDGALLDGASRPEAASAGLSEEAPSRRAAKVLVLSSRTAALLEEETRDWQFGGEYPLVVEIPSPGAGADERRSLVAAIREAVGISI